MVSTQTARDKRNQRRNWRQLQRKHRQGSRAAEPPNLNTSNYPDVSATSSRRGAAARREKSKRNKEMKRLKRENTQMKRKVWRLSKQLVKNHDNATPPTEFNVTTSPKKLALDVMRSKRKVRTCLLAHFSLLQHMSSNSKDKKRLFALARKISKKYRGLQSHFRRTTKSAQRSLSQKEEKEERKQIEISTEEIVRNFYCRDDNSRNTSGKKETITRKKIKMQKRYLTFTQEVLYEKFESEYPGLVGRSTFYNYRPFWVLRPRINDRETCLCVRCCNIQVSQSIFYIFPKH